MKNPLVAGLFPENEDSPTGSETALMLIWLIAGIENTRVHSIANKPAFIKFPSVQYRLGWLADIFVPQLRLIMDKLFHQSDAFLTVNDFNINAA